MRSTMLAQLSQRASLKEASVCVEPEDDARLNDAIQYFAKATAPAFDFTSHGFLSAAADDVDSDGDGVPVGSSKRGRGSSLQDDDSSAVTNPTARERSAGVTTYLSRDVVPNLRPPSARPPDPRRGLWTTCPPTVVGGT